MNNNQRLEFLNSLERGDMYTVSVMESKYTRIYIRHRRYADRLEVDTRLLEDKTLKPFTFTFYDVQMDDDKKVTYEKMSGGDEE